MTPLRLAHVPWPNLSLRWHALAVFKHDLCYVDFSSFWFGVGSYVDDGMEHKQFVDAAS
jgi:hypothetical protein